MSMYDERYDGYLPMSNNHQGVKVVSLLMVETGVYSEMYSRPMTSDLNGTTLNQYADATQGGRRLSREAMASVASSIIKPQAEPGAVIGIPNGWSTKRYRFLIRVEVAISALSPPLTYLISGYTDHTGSMGTSIAGVLDPQMRLYFDKSIQLRSTVVTGNSGYQTHYAITNASHIMTSDGITPTQQYAGSLFGQYRPPQNTLCTLRPEDLVGQLEIDAVMQGEPSGGLLNIAASIPSSYTPTQARKSSLSNGIASDYLSRSVLGIVNATKDPMQPFTENSGDIYSRAVESVREAPVAADRFLQELTMNTSYGQSQSLSWADFCVLFPEADSMTQVITGGSLSTPTLTMSESFRSSTQETMIATVLAQAVPALMMELMIVSLTIQFTNLTENGLMSIYPSNPETFASGLDLTNHLTTFMHRFDMEVLSGITMCNQKALSGKMSVSVTGDTYISLSYMGHPTIDYVIPSFCSARFTSMVTFDPTTLPNLAHDLATVVEQSSVSY